MLLFFLGGLGVALYTEPGRCRAWADLRTWAGRTRAAGNGGREGPGSWGFLLGVALGVALYTERGAAWAGVMAADLGTSAPAHAACPGGGQGEEWRATAALPGRPRAVFILM